MVSLDPKHLLYRNETEFAEDKAGELAAYYVKRNLAARRRGAARLSEKALQPRPFGCPFAPLSGLRLRACPQRSEGAGLAVGNARAGGLFAEKAGEWHAALKRLVEDVALRKPLGEAGRRKAEERESTRVVETWLRILRVHSAPR